MYVIVRSPVGRPARKKLCFKKRLQGARGSARCTAADNAHRLQCNLCVCISAACLDIIYDLFLLFLFLPQYRHSSMFSVFLRACTSVLPLCFFHMSLGADLYEARIYLLTLATRSCKSGGRIDFSSPTLYLIYSRSFDPTISLIRILLSRW